MKFGEKRGEVIRMDTYNMIDFNEKKGFICDMDGVIYHGNRVLPGVAEFIQWLHDENKEYLFLTNNSGYTPRELSQKLARMGLDVTEEHFYTSALATVGNAYDPTREIVTGRGNLSFTTINLPRLGIKAQRNIGAFFDSLDELMDLCIDQLMHRFKIQCSKRVRNYPFLMGQGIWLDSEKLTADDTLEEVLKHGTLSVGFIGLAECLKVLTGKHHGESEEAILTHFVISYSISLSIFFNSTSLSRSSAAASKFNSAAAFFICFVRSAISFSSSFWLMDSGSFSSRISSAATFLEILIRSRTDF